MPNIQPIFESGVSSFYVEETLTFELGLHKGSDVVWAHEYDVEVCVYTNQLSDRLWVCDYSCGYVPEDERRESAAGGSIAKGRKGFWLTLRPELLSQLERGSVLVLGIRYCGRSFDEAHVVQTCRLQSIKLGGCE